MYLYESMGVAVLELDSHPDHNKEPDDNKCRLDPSHRSLILAILHSRQPYTALVHHYNLALVYYFFYFANYKK